MIDHYDVAIIGGGTGGLIAADAARNFGLKVVLIEKGRMGGDCTWTGCVPSKALIHAAKVVHHASTAETFGLTMPKQQIDMHKVRKYVMGAIQEIYQHETPEVLRGEGIEVLQGMASFVDSHTILVDQQAITAKKFIIATGSSPFIPPIRGLDSAAYFTNEEFFENTHLPKHLLIIGAGPVGCELGQAYHRLGAEVTLIDEALLPGEEQQVSEVLSKVFKKEGINFLAGLVDSVGQSGSDIVLSIGEQEIHGDMLLLAAGRKAAIQSLKLESAGVTTLEDGIVVDANLQTNVKHIYAVGDCVAGNDHFTHLAGWQAFQAVRNACLPGNDPGFSDSSPRGIFTDPEIAHVGPTEEKARQLYGDRVQVAHMPLDRVDRAVTHHDTEGYIKILYLANRRIIGATIVAERAGDAINEFVVAIDRKLKLEEAARSIHVYPTYGGSAQLLMSQAASQAILSGPLGAVIKAMAS